VTVLGPAEVRGKEVMLTLGCCSDLYQSTSMCLAKTDDDGEEGDVLGVRSRRRSKTVRQLQKRMNSQNATTSRVSLHLR